MRLFGAFLNRLLVTSFGQALFGIWLARHKILCAELLWRARRDQQVRGAWIKPRQHLTVQRLKEFIRIDLSNTRRMHQIIAQYGWPGKTLVGPIGEQAAWLLVQHADHDPAFQKDCLSLLAETIKEDQSALSLFAYLTDRVRMHDGLPQVYGTQLRGDFEPFTIEDEDHVDERRAKAGLSPLAEYLEQLHPASANEFPYAQVLAETKRLLSQLPPLAEYDAYVVQMKRILDVTDSS